MLQRHPQILLLRAFFFLYLLLAQRWLVGKNRPPPSLLRVEALPRSMIISSTTRSGKTLPWSGEIILSIHESLNKDMAEADLHRYIIPPLIYFCLSFSPQIGQSVFGMGADEKRLCRMMIKI